MKLCCKVKYTKACISLDRILFKFEVQLLNMCNQVTNRSKDTINFNLQMTANLWSRSFQTHRITWQSLLLVSQVRQRPLGATHYPLLSQ